MNTRLEVSQDERIMAGLAHGSILLGFFTNGIGGIGAALLIWLTQKEKSVYVARQAMQALMYQVATFVLAFVIWGCWGVLFMMMFLPPILANPEAYNNAPPPGMWVGMTLMIFPLITMALTVVYGLWGAVRTFSGHDFKYVVVGKWLDNRT